MMLLVTAISFAPVHPSVHSAKTLLNLNFYKGIPITGVPLALY
jgi:hypothetical protein